MTEIGTLTLAEFLLARIAEDEADAHDTDPLPEDAVFDHDVTGWWQTERVLAECEAKRRILALHPTNVTRAGEAWCDCQMSDDYGPVGREPCPEKRALAAVYADHPDYRDEWRP